jgi:hypothetical protein
MQWMKKMVATLATKGGAETLAERARKSGGRTRTEFDEGGIMAWNDLEWITIKGKELQIGRQG